MLTLLAFLCTLTLVIVVHEYGHYQVALWCGVRVLRFSVGFGPPLWEKKCRNGTTLALAAIPLGGYVKLLDKNSEDKEVHNPQQAFHAQPPLRRMGIILAGPTANFLLALLIYCALLLSGISGIKPMIGQVDAGSPAAKAGLSAGEIIQRVDDVAVTSWNDVHWRLLAVTDHNSVVIETLNSRHELLVYRLFLTASAAKNPILALGLHAYYPKLPARIFKVSPHSVAERAGLQAQDSLLAVNQEPLADWSALVDVVRAHPQQKLTLLVQRGERTFNVELTPQAVSEHGQQVGKIGISVDSDAAQRLLRVSHQETLLPALWHSLQKTTALIKLNFVSLAGLLTGKNSWRNLAGPITIANLAGHSATLGIQPFLQFIALLSVTVGALNLLPLPLLDGGRLLYDASEFFFGKPCSARLLSFTHPLGIIVIVLIMGIVLYNDFRMLLGTPTP